MSQPGTLTGAKAKRRTHWLVEILTVLLVAFVVSAFVRAFIAQAYYIPSGSMQQTLQKDDWIVVSKLSSRFGAAERGDVVVFADPGGWLPDAQVRVNPIRRALEFVGAAPDSSEGDLVKRVIGTGGDTVSCCDPQGRLEVNGKPIDEPYLFPDDTPGDAPPGCEGQFEATVPAGYLWVMGDHRSVSEDSRCQQDLQKFVPLDNVRGRAVAVVWPFARWSLIDRASAFDGVP